MKKKEHKPLIKASVLEVRMYKDEISGKTLIEWDYPVRQNCYFLIGVLETIKQELLDEIDENGKDSIEIF